ncbi:response regulator transcription factor [Pseudoruegeria sp. HB172150]|uniref:response regulator transcription factor n=1 Tax=Pseudoruegeria sp. HB172150 TaxID=2721164 RepID=UPI001553AE08|nr:response regulator transcription factor [Pseudoruegeria sp. HB172150]
MSDPNRILIVEDDQEISGLLRRYLESNGMLASEAFDALSMDKALGQNEFDLIVLDICLPGEDGLSICRRLKAAVPDRPVLMLSGKDTQSEGVTSITALADDLVTKPFDPSELLTRIRATLKIDSTEETGLVNVPRFQFAGWILDVNECLLHDPDGVRIILADTELKLLRVFCEKPEQMLPHKQLLNEFSGSNSSADEHSIDALIGRLRLKIEENPDIPVLIRSMGVEGYWLAAEVVRN